jgi:hypothetical protein
LVCTRIDIAILLAEINDLIKTFDMESMVKEDYWIIELLLSIGDHLNEFIGLQVGSVNLDVPRLIEIASQSFQGAVRNQQRTQEREKLLPILTEGVLFRVLL